MNEAIEGGCLKTGHPLAKKTVIRHHSKPRLSQAGAFLCSKYLVTL
jgi:hypothetical protein